MLRTHLEKTVRHSNHARCRSGSKCFAEHTEPTSTAVATVVHTPFPVFTGAMLEPQGFVQRTHDPVLAQAGDTYYVFSTGSRIPFIY